mgnify:CR=1 FL=1
MGWMPKLLLVEQGTGRRFEFPVDRALNGGWAGRDQEAVRKHIEELAAIGVPGPTRTPTLYALSNYLVTTADTVQVQHGKTSGEVEYVLLIGAGDEVYVTVGSDHTDRDLETRDIEWSKQAYPNVLAPEVWRYREVADHWDELVLRCWVVKEGERRLYQEAALSALQPPGVWFGLLEGLFGSKRANLVVMSGTVATHGGLVYADSYDMELHDPVLRRTIRHGYRVELLREKVV